MIKPPPNNNIPIKTIIGQVANISKLIKDDKLIDVPHPIPKELVQDQNYNTEPKPDISDPGSL